MVAHCQKPIVFRRSPHSFFETPVFSDHGGKDKKVKGKVLAKDPNVEESEMGFQLPGREICQYFPLVQTLIPTFSPSSFMDDQYTKNHSLLLAWM